MGIESEPRTPEIIDPFDSHEKTAIELYSRAQHNFGYTKSILQGQFRVLQEIMLDPKDERDHHKLWEKIGETYISLGIAADMADLAETLMIEAQRFRENHVSTPESGDITT